MKLPYSRVLLAVVLATVILAPGRTAAAQTLGDAQLGVRVNVPSAPRSAASLSLQESGGIPRWVKWGLVGAAAGAVTFALLSGTDAGGDRNATADAALGAVFGFVVLGGGVAFYDWVCKPGSGSQRAGLC